MQARATPAQVLLELRIFAPAEELVLQVAVDLLGVVVKAAGERKMGN